MNLKALLTRLSKEDTPDEEERADAPTPSHHTEDSEKVERGTDVTTRSGGTTREDDEDLEHDDDQEDDDDLHDVDLDNQPTASPHGLRRVFARISSSLCPSPNNEEEIQAYIPHYRILPILSGVAIPFCILLDIPGLTADWYTRTDGSTIVASKHNPPLLVIGVALSLVCAVLANICLVVRFLETRIKTMTILCVLFLSIHGTLSVIFPPCDSSTVFRYYQHCCSCYIRSNEGWLHIQSGVLDDFVLHDCIHVHERDPYH